tara:strand:- start:32 stop:553 length:522 start_codon:yes stop_codon:yes gene_type:complete
MCRLDNQRVADYNESEFKIEVNFIQKQNRAVFIGTYIGYEFTDDGDVGHKFSNHISAIVGNKLKAMYKEDGLYYKVDLEKIQISTQGMASGIVRYSCVIPLNSVAEKCDAMTSFDYVGGWGHSPTLETRKKELSKALLQVDSLHISSLKTTPEGLEEYWIKWRNKNNQACYVQ